MAISNVPWFATTVEGPFDVGTVGIFATIVRVVQAFVCVWMIIKVNIKFILPEQTGGQYSHQQYDIIIDYISVPKGLGLRGSGAPDSKQRGSGAPHQNERGSRAPEKLIKGSRLCYAFFALI